MTIIPAVPISLELNFPKIHILYLSSADKPDFANNEHKNAA